MNEQLQKYARDSLKKGLSKLSEDNILMFKKMYSRNNLEKPVNDVVDEMPEDKLGWAMMQLNNTLSKRVAKQMQEDLEIDKD